MLLSIYFGAGLAMMVAFVLPEILRAGAQTFATPSVSALALPLVLSVGLATGVRILITIPADMGARWVFQTSVNPAAPCRRRRAQDDAAAGGGADGRDRRGERRACCGAGSRRVQHAAYCGALSTALCELMLLRYRGIPLTRPYIPGASRFHLLWALSISPRSPPTRSRQRNWNAT